MRNKAQVWTLYGQATTFRQSPADLLGLSEPWIRWQFERAVWSLGRHVEGEIDKMRMARHKNGKPKYSDDEIERAVKEILGVKPEKTDKRLSREAEVRQVFGGLVGPPK